MDLKDPTAHLDLPDHQVCFNMFRITRENGDNLKIVLYLVFNINLEYIGPPGPFGPDRPGPKGPKGESARVLT